MDRAMCSYFIGLSGDAADMDAAIAWLDSKGVTGPGGFMTVERHTAAQSTELNVTDGSTEQWNEMKETMDMLSAAFPKLAISVDENCEEPFVFPRYLHYEDGDLKIDRYGRLLLPFEYDKKTADAIIAILAEKGMTDAEAAVRRFMRDNYV